MTTNLGPIIVKHVSTSESLTKINEDMTKLCALILRFGAAHREHWENLQHEERFDVIYSRSEFKEYKEIIDTYTLVISMVLRHNFYHHLAFKKYLRLLQQEGDKVVNPLTYKKCSAKYVRFLYQMLNPGATAAKLDEIEKDTLESAIKQEAEFQESVKNAAVKIREQDQKIQKENAANFKNLIINTKNTKELVSRMIKLTEENKKQHDASSVTYKGVKVEPMVNIPKGGLVFENPNVPNVIYKNEPKNKKVKGKLNVIDERDAVASEKDEKSK
jgi:hypothetical protein